MPAFIHVGLGYYEYAYVVIVTVVVAVFSYLFIQDVGVSALLKLRSCADV